MNTITAHYRTLFRTLCSHYLTLSYLHIYKRNYPLSCPDPRGPLFYIVSLRKNLVRRLLAGYLVMESITNTNSNKENRKAKKKLLEGRIEELAKLHQTIERLTKKKEKWKQKYEERAAKERGEKDELEDTKKAVGEAKKRMTILEKRLEAAMKRNVPIVAAIVLKAVYKHAVGIPQQDESPENQDTRGERIKSLSEMFHQFGCENAGQVVELADAVSFNSFTFLGCGED